MCTDVAIMPLFIISFIEIFPVEKAVPVAAPAHGSIIAMPHAGNMYANISGRISKDIAAGMKIFAIILTVAVPLIKLLKIAVDTAAVKNTAMREMF